MFIETPRFPEPISKNSVGGPTFKTIISPSTGGYKQRQAEWDMPLYEYDVGWGIRTITDIEILLNFFNALKGGAYSFRFKDWLDYKSCSVTGTPAWNNQELSLIPGETHYFQLTKMYYFGSVGSPTLATYRYITKPITATVKAGYANENDLSWHLETYNGEETGIIHTPDNEPPHFYAGFEFDVPVAFKEDALPLTSLDYQIVEKYNILLEEQKIDYLDAIA